MLVRQFVTDALVEIGIVGADETVDPSDADLGLRYLQAMVDLFVGDRLLLYIVNRTAYALTPGMNANMIGATQVAPHWTGPIPVATALAYVNVVAPGDTQEYTIVPWHVKADFYAQTDKVQQAPYPTRYLYEPGPTFGRFLWWPVPSTAAQVILATAGVLTSPITLDTDLVFPSGGYYECWRLQLAQRLQRPFLLPPDPSLRADAQHALSMVKRLNDEAPPFSHSDPAVLSDWPSLTPTTSGVLR